jgi:pimeloyl-ACP methyl ester carboxylesterase
MMCMGEALCIVALVVVGYGLICFLTAVFYVAPPRFRAHCPPELAETMIGDAPAWVSPALLNREPVKGIFLFAHGYGSGSSRRVWAKMAVAFTQEGYGIVAPAMPAHDANRDRISGFGTKESQIVRNCVLWVTERICADQRPPIVAVGLSMGGAACWLAAAQELRIDGVVSEGAFAEFDEASDYWVDAFIPGIRWLFWPAKWMAIQMTHLDPKSIRPVDAAAARRGIPALVLHGERDRMIPRSHAERLAMVSGANLWIVPNAGHDTTQKVAYDEYRARIQAVMDSCSARLLVTPPT